MNISHSTNRKFKRMFVHILSIFVILTMAFPAMGSASAQEPVPHFYASTAHNGIWGADFVPGTELTFSIYDAPNGNLLWSGNKTADNSGQVWIGGADHPVDLVPGYQVVISMAGAPIKDLVLEAVTVDLFDVDQGLLQGTAPAGRTLWIGVDFDATHLGLEVTADSETGAWIADFGTPVPTNYTWAGAQLFDSDGDATEANPPRPIITISTSNNYLRADNFSPNTTVTFTVYSTQDPGENPLWSDSRTTDGNGFAIIWPWEQPLDLVVGNYMVASDGINDKQLALEAVTLDVFDPDADFLAGTAPTAPEGRFVWVWTGNGSNGCGMGVTADPVNGAWTADFTTQPCNITVDMEGAAHVYDEDGDVTVFHQGPPPPPPSPWFIAFPENDAVEGWEWPDGATVTVSINNAPGLSWSGTAAVTTWGDPRTYVRFDFADAYDLKIGDTVTLTGQDGTIRTHTVQNLSLTDVNMEEDIVKGTANSGTQVQAWAHQQSVPPMDVTADNNGNWQADLTGIYDITFDTAGRSQVMVDGNATAVDWSAPPPPPSPWLIAFPENDAVEGWEWPEGTTVTLTIDNVPGMDWTGVSQVTTWGDPRTYVRLEFGNEYDLKIGDQVTLTDEFGTTRTHTVQNLSVTGVHMDEDTVTGTANAGVSLQVWAHQQSGPPVDVMAGEDGTWLADLTGVYDIGFNTGGRSQIVIDGNATAVDWNAPPLPFIAVSLTQEWFMGDYWPPETLVTISVYEFQGASTPVLELSRYTDPSGHLSIEGWEHNWDLEPGNVVTAKDGSTTKELSLEYITLDVFDPESDLISGTGLGGRRVDVGVGNGDGEQWLTVYADEVSGVWTADFTTVGFNITEDMWAGGHVNDEDGDVTAAHNSGRSLPPNPRIVASITENWFYLLDFVPGALVNLSIYESQGGGQVWAGTATTDGSGFAWVNAVEHGWDLEPGTYLLVSDGNSTKELVIEEFTFKLFDVTRGLLKGTASEPFGRQVWVGIGWENDRWSMDVTTSKKGAWKADFGAPVPNGYDWVAAQIFDPDGDASELRPARTIGRTVTVGNFYVEWSTANPEEVVDLRWNDSVNLTNTWTHPACSGDLEFFGNSWVSENEGEDPFFFASLVGWGTTGTWNEQTNTKIRIGSKSSGCPGSADIPIKTDYRFFNEDLRANLIVVKRMFKFGDVPYAHDVRPFIPRLYPSDGFTEVLHPDANGTTLVTEGTCDFGCPAASWDGSWFAIHNPATGVGMIVQRKPSSYAAALWLDDDDGSFTNSSSILLLQPVGGFTGTVTETEYLCFYDSNIWSPSLTLPPGCQP